MLNTDEIAMRLNHPVTNHDRLAIVPRPNLDAMFTRSATSVDLRLGRWFRSFKQNQTPNFPLWRDGPDDDGNDTSGIGTKEHFVRFGEEFILHPGRFVLGVTLEWLSLPSTLSGYVTGKSSLGRHGLIIETAAGIHPKFTGCLTLELANCGEIPLTLAPGMSICQIFLHSTKTGSGSSGGDFSGQRKPSIKLPSRDPVFDKLRASRADRPPTPAPDIAVTSPDVEAA
ncbi:dCTP deaminase [Glacieibacterium megasporae]|uniref:dCTP deaminase n=1 Tax=Glacieibacterium megasporae TaxID=2835787 RepID=UPI001C1E6201|nr:dCTP deaminase [Polymorphobacter megasporae]UAJ10947.1 dCTP deaminase [Polymorphobacter megasporae]